MTKYYAVKKGHQPGIYDNWIDCQKQTNKFPHAQFQSFKSYEDAQKFMNDQSILNNKKVKYYAVKKGHHPGIYQSWEECQKETNKFPHAEFKKFNSYNEAKKFIKNVKKQKSQYELNVYTDGGCRNHGNNKGEHVQDTDPAAWAFKIDGITQMQQCGGHLGYTNNQMELTAFLMALKALTKHHLNSHKIQFILDSKYVLNGLQKYMPNWISRNFINVKNADLWKNINDELNNFDNYQLSWTKGHANNQGNIFVDHKLNDYMDYQEKVVQNKKLQ